MKVGDVVKVKMVRDAIESFTNDDGVLDIRVVGEVVDYVPDRIEKIMHDGFVWCEKCHLVAIEDVLGADYNDRQRVELDDTKVLGMLSQGDKLMAALVEPELI